jgi:hypothetical protein
MVGKKLPVCTVLAKHNEGEERVSGVFSEVPDIRRELELSQELQHCQ